MELRDYVRLLRRNALMLILFILAAGIAGYAYVGAQPRIYQASATILVRPVDAATLGELQAGNAYAESAAATVATLIRSTPVLEAVPTDIQAGAVFAVASESSALVVITSSAATGAQAAETANAVAASAEEVVPELLSSRRSVAAQQPLLDLRIVQPAVGPSQPVSPNDRRILVMFLALGLGLGLATALVRHSLDTRLRRSEDVLAVSNLPLLATVSRERRPRKSGVVVRDSPASTAVEGYRGLRTALTRLDGEARRSVLVVAASDDGSGARVPANVAWSLAVAGRRTLLVDLDLRHDEIADKFGLPHAPGAADLLAGSTDLQQVAQTTAIPRLTVVVSGHAALPPSDLLSDQWLAKLVREAEHEFDYVVLHAPPLLSFTDSAVVARAVAHTVVTVRADHTTAPDLNSAIGVLSNVEVGPLGLVLTEARVSVPDNIRARRRAESSRPGRGTRSTLRRADQAEV